MKFQLKFLSVPFFIIGLVIPTLQGQSCAFTVSDPTPCGGDTLTLTVNNPDSAAAYEWNLSDLGLGPAAGDSIRVVLPFSDSPQVYEIQLSKKDGTCSDLVQVTASGLPAPEITVLAPDVLSGDTIHTCSNTPGAPLTLYNNNTSAYSLVEVDWGDGSPVETFPGNTPSFGPHNYTSYGYFQITITGQSLNGCQRTKSYAFYLGSNPSVGLTLPGNTVNLCAPTTLTFPIEEVQNNPPGTLYEIRINDLLIDTFSQENLKTSFTHTFNESSCNKTTFTGTNHSFDVMVVASNPCGVSRAIIEPIEISTKPTAVIGTKPPEKSCPGTTYTFVNESQDIAEVVSGDPSTCSEALPPFWSIEGGTEGVDWGYVSGFPFGDEIQVIFYTPGTYTAKLSLTSVACGEVNTSTQVTILEPPTASFDATFDGSGCVNSEIRVNNLSIGDQLSYKYGISPAAGVSFANGSTPTDSNPVLEVSQAGIYTILLTASNVCDTATFDTTLTFTDKPEVSLSTPDNFCESGAISSTDLNPVLKDNLSPITDITYLFPGGNPDTVKGINPGKVFYDTPGTYPITLSATNSCGTTQRTVQLTIDAPVNLDMPDDRDVCIDQGEIQLYVPQTPGSWSGKGVSADGRFNPAIAGPGAHVLTYTHSVNSCINQDSVTIRVRELPDLSLGLPTNVCENSGLVPVNVLPAGGQLRVNNGGVLSGDAFDPAASGPGLFQITYSYTSPFGCRQSISRSILVSPAPPVRLNDLTLCNRPGKVELSNFRPEGGILSGPGIDSLTFDPVLAGGVGQYRIYYDFTASNGCSNRDSAIVTVIELEVVNAGPDTFICVDSNPLDLSIGTSHPGVGRWEANGNPGLTGSVFDPAIAGPGTYTFILSVGSGNCEVTDRKTVTVIPRANLEILDSPDAVCISDTSVVLQANLPGVIFSSPDGVISTDGIFNPAASGIGTFNINLEYTDRYGCSSSASISREIVVRPLPDASFEPADSTVCAAGATQFVANTPDLDHQYDFGDGNTSTLMQPIHIYDSAGTYTVTHTVTDDIGCTNNSTFRYLTVNPRPKAAFDFTRDTECGDTEVTTTNQSMGATDHKWHRGDGTQTSAFEFVQVYSDTGWYTIQLEAINEFGCRDTARRSFKVRPIPVADLSLERSEICQREDNIFRSESAFANQIQWVTPMGLDSSGPVAEIVIDTAGLFRIGLIASYDGVCFDSLFLDDALRVWPTPEADFEYEEIFRQPNTPGGEMQFKNRSEGADYFGWFFGDGNSSFEENPQHRYYSNGVWLVTLVATTERGCSDTIVKQIIPEFISGLFLPNAFAPDHRDKVYGKFKALGIGVREYELIVYDRYGQRIWSTTKIENGMPVEFWDGTHKGGAVPPGTYIWEMSAIMEDGTPWPGMPDKTGKLKRQGTVQLIR